MKTAYWILNLVGSALTAMALSSLLYPEINDQVVDLVGPKYAYIEIPCGLFFGYLVLSILSTIIGVIALCVQGLETARFPFYCVALTWAPLILLAILGGILTASGQLFWRT